MITCMTRNFFDYLELLKVMGIPHAKFEEKLERMKEKKGVKNDTDLSATDLKDLVEQYKSVYVQVKGQEFPSGLISYFFI